jgi:hypothetical protein
MCKLQCYKSSDRKTHDSNNLYWLQYPLSLLFLLSLTQYPGFTTLIHCASTTCAISKGCGNLLWKQWFPTYYCVIQQLCGYSNNMTLIPKSYNKTKRNSREFVTKPERHWLSPCMMREPLWNFFPRKKELFVSSFYPFLSIISIEEQLKSH